MKLAGCRSRAKDREPLSRTGCGPRGRWRTPQEIEILETSARTELAEKDWLAKIRRWRRDLDDPAKAKLGYESLLAIRDPIAVRPLSEAFRRESVRRVKMLYADEMPLLEKIRTIAKEIYRARDISADKAVRDQLAAFEAMGYGIPVVGQAPDGCTCAAPRATR